MRTELIDPNDISLDVSLSMVDVLDGIHRLKVDIRLYNPEYGDTAKIGTIWALLCWDARPLPAWELYYQADALDEQSAVLGHAASQAILWHQRHANPLQQMPVLMIDILRLDPEHRGRKLTDAIMDALVTLLGLDPAATLILIDKLPVTEARQYYEPGPERDAAENKVDAALKVAGFKPWNEVVSIRSRNLPGRLPRNEPKMLHEGPPPSVGWVIAGD